MLANLTKRVIRKTTVIPLFRDYNWEMAWSPRKSTSIVLVFALFNGAVILSIFKQKDSQDWGKDSDALINNIPSEMTELEYFHLKNGEPSLSLAADTMQSLGEERAEFERPRGVYVSSDKTSVFYRALHGDYRKDLGRLFLKGDVVLDRLTTHYEAQQVVYHPKQDSMEGDGQVLIVHHLKKTGDKLEVRAQHMKGRLKQEWSLLNGQVIGHLTPKLKFKPPLNFRTRELELLGKDAEARLRGDVFFQREGMQVTAQNGDIFLENANKKLKYFVLNDDVRLTEQLQDDQGLPITRKAWAERLEGFGEERMVLSGAPRVEQGKDVVRGYRITMREKLEFLEVEDSMSDLSVKKKKKPAAQATKGP